MNTTLFFSVIAEDRVELINRILMILNRRRINITRFNASKDEALQQYQMEFVLETPEEIGKKALLQIRKQIGVVQILMKQADSQKKNNFFFAAV